LSVKDLRLEEMQSPIDAHEKTRRKTSEKPGANFEKPGVETVKNPVENPGNLSTKTRHRFGFAAPRIQDTKAKAALFEK
jgi:hypothetical protein